MGTVAKPVAGVLDLASATASAVRDSSRSSLKMHPKPIREARCCHGPGGLLPVYSTHQAKAQRNLFALNENNYREMWVCSAYRNGDYHTMYPVYTRQNDVNRDLDRNYCNAEDVPVYTGHLIHLISGLKLSRLWSRLSVHTGQNFSIPIILLRVNGVIVYSDLNISLIKIYIILSSWYSYIYKFTEKAAKYWWSFFVWILLKYKPCSLFGMFVCGQIHRIWAAASRTRGWPSRSHLQRAGVLPWQGGTNGPW